MWMQRAGTSVHVYVHYLLHDAERELGYERHSDVQHNADEKNA